MEFSPEWLPTNPPHHYRAHHSRENRGAAGGQPSTFVPFFLALFLGLQLGLLPGDAFSIISSYLQHPFEPWGSVCPGLMLAHSPYWSASEG